MQSSISISKKIKIKNCNYTIFEIILVPQAGETQPQNVECFKNLKEM